MIKSTSTPDGSCSLLSEGILRRNEFFIVMEAIPPVERIVSPQTAEVSRRFNAATEALAGAASKGKNHILAACQQSKSRHGDSFHGGSDEFESLLFNLKIDEDYSVTVLLMCILPGVVLYTSSIR